MRQLPVPPSVRERLGDKAALDLSIWVDAHENGWRDSVLEMAGDRFGRTLAEELSKIRVELASQRVEISREIAAQRKEISHEIAAQRKEISHEIATAKVAVLKWSFVFWLGQILVIMNLIGWMLRGVTAQ